MPGAPGTPFTRVKTTKRSATSARLMSVFVPFKTARSPVISALVR